MAKTNKPQFRYELHYSEHLFKNSDNVLLNRTEYFKSKKRAIAFYNMFKNDKTVEDWYIFDTKTNKKIEMKDIVIPLPKNVKDKLKKFRLQYQDERIQKFIEACKRRFFGAKYLCNSAFVDAICGHAFNETYDPHNVYISNDFDVMLKNKENADIFF